MEFYNRNWRVLNSWNGTEDNNNKVSNYSMSFDGSTEYVDLGDADVFSFGNGSTDSPFSISAWVKMDNATNFGIISKSDNTNGNSEYLFYTDALNRITLLLYSAVSTNRYRGRKYSVALTEGVWMHLAATYDGQGGVNAQDGIKIYVNGASVDNTDISNGTYVAMPNGNAPLEIGVKGNQRSNGKIDQVAIFDYALSQAQVTQLYGSSSTGVGNPMAITNGRKPVAYYPLGDHSAFNGEYLVANSALSDYVFDFVSSSSQQISLSSAFVASGEFTLSLWVNPDDLVNNNFLGNSSAGSNWLQIKTASQIKIKIASTAVIAFTESGGNNLTASAWNHILIYRDSSNNVGAYVNGQTFGSTGSNTSTLTLSTIGRATSIYFDGNISNVAFFDIALPATGTESVASLYNYGTPPNISSYSNLQGWWKLDAGSTFDGSNWTVPDESSNLNNGTSSGMSAANLVQSNLNILSPYSRYALNFDGSNDYVDCGTSTAIASASSYSISAWVRINTAGGTFFSSGTSNTDRTFLFIDASTVNFGVKTGTGGVISWANSFTSVWHHIVGVVNAGTSYLYVDGVQKATGSVSALSATAGNNVKIGNTTSPMSSFPFDGTISNCSIWNAALNSAQVTEIYNEGKPSNLNNHSAYSNLVSWWQLGENSSFNSNWTVIDEKGTNNGTSANMSEDDLVDGVGTTANGLSSGMGGADNINGDAPYSTSNALSYGMGADAKSTSVPT